MVAEMIGAPVPDHLWRTTTSERNDAMKKISTATDQKSGEPEADDWFGPGRPIELVLRAG
jgi:hypothetical protein